jgi:hypothetical protein
VVSAEQERDASVLALDICVRLIGEQLVLFTSRPPQPVIDHR